MTVELDCSQQSRSGDGLRFYAVPVVSGVFPPHPLLSVPVAIQIHAK